MIKRTGLLILFVVAAFLNTAEAKLIKVGTATYNNRCYNLIYEDDQKLIWLDYTNPGSRRVFQERWVSGLNDPGVLTYEFDSGVSVTWKGDWRLPKAVDGSRKFGYDGTTTAGFNITSSEFGHLFYVSLGNLGYYDTNGNPRPGWGKPEKEHAWGLKNTGPFKNLDTGLDARYWGGTKYSRNPVHSWDFSMYWGSQDILGLRSKSHRAIVVRSADVVVP